MVVQEVCDTWTGAVVFWGCPTVSLSQLGAAHGQGGLEGNGSAASIVERVMKMIHDPLWRDQAESGKKKE
jgi:hypothetical protein